MQVQIDWKNGFYRDIMDEFGIEMKDNYFLQIDNALKLHYGLDYYSNGTGYGNPILDMNKFFVFQLKYGNYIIKVVK